MNGFRETCQGCDRPIDPGQTHCSCGRPTAYASFEERAAFEVAQWRAYRERVTAGAA